MGDTTERYGKFKAPYAERERSYGPKGNRSTDITPKGGSSTSRVAGMKKKAAIEQAKSDAEGMSVDYEGMNKAYKDYKLSKDPSVEKLTSQLSKGSVKAEKPLEKALQAADDAKLAGREEVESRLKKAAAPKPGEYNFKKGGSVKSSASSRGDGCAQRGKTRGRVI